MPIPLDEELSILQILHSVHIPRRREQVRRPTGRPQGILNIGVALLDGCLRSMPLYKGCPSAVGYRDLMLDLPPNLQWPQRNENDEDNNRPSTARPMLLRSRSERSIGFDMYSTNGSMVGAPTRKVFDKSSSILSISEPVDPFMITKGKGKGKGKASSVTNGAELREKPKEKGKKGKASSVLSDSIFSKSSSFKKKAILENNDANKKAEEKPVGDDQKLAVVAIGKPVGSIQLGRGPYRGGSILSTSEVGPSASEVAAAMMMTERRYPLADNESSVLDGWSLDESIEGLKSKLQRWRTELPPLYDHHGYSSASYKSSAAHSRSRSESSSSLFSCFGNICGYECQCIIGQPPSPRRKNRGSRFSSSADSRSLSLL